MKKFKNNKIANFSAVFLAIAFVVCSLSVSTAHVLAANSHANHAVPCGGQTDTGDLVQISEHHLLTQPAPIDALNIVLPVAINNFSILSLSTITQYNKIEIINNQGAPPLKEPLGLGIVNTKVW